MNIKGTVNDAAYEMRMRGYDVTAKPAVVNTFDDFSEKHWYEIFEGAVIEKVTEGDGKAEIIAKMQSWGDGARAEIYVAWQKAGAHVFIAENRSGEIYFLDPQTGELDVEYYFENVKEGCTQFFRIDNLEANEKYIKKCCEEIGND